MSSTLTPLPVSIDMVRGRLGGLTTYLDRVAAGALETPSDYVSRWIRWAQAELEDKTMAPYFVTRFTTEELARQLSLTQGVAGDTGYDEIIQPLDYDAEEWRRASGRTELPKAPITSFQTYRLSLQQNGKIVDIPTDWLQVDARKATVHLMPQALNTLGVTYFTLYAINPVLYRPGLVPITPQLVHLRFSAGFCERTAANGTDPYDPDAQQKNSKWPQHEVAAYQQMLATYASVPILRDLAPQIKGFIQISIDGMSRSGNSNLLLDMAIQREAAVNAWTDRQKTKAMGAGWVMV